MNKLLLSPEYNCFPLWLYDEDGCVEENLLIPELADNKTLVELLNAIQETYDSFFIDNETEFLYVGPSSEQERVIFESNLGKAVSIIQDAVGKQYEVVLDPSIV